jgi:hypothetical protein
MGFCTHSFRDQIPRGHERKFLLRYNFAEGRDLFIIYNEGLTIDPITHRLNALGERSILVKFSYTLVYG